MCADRSSRDLGQALIVLWDGHEDPSTIRHLIAEQGVGSVVITCKGAPGKELPRNPALQGTCANMRLQTQLTLQAARGSSSRSPRMLDTSDRSLLG